MTFGEKVRELRQANQLTLRNLAAKVGVGFTYLSKIENHKLKNGHSPSEKLIHKIATELNASEDELLLLAEKVPEPIRRRFIERPDIFLKLASMDDDTLNDMMRNIDRD